jgi:hypothetical protein
MYFIFLKLNYYSMAIFQNTVVNKYLNNQNEQVISEKWNIYKTHFFDPEVQENIRDSKEKSIKKVLCGIYLLMFLGIP